MKFIVNLIRNDSQKRQKRQKRHILALCFFPPGRACTPRVAKQKTSHGSILPMIYLCINYNLLQNYILKQMKLYIQFIYNYVQARKNYIETKN